MQNVIWHEAKQSEAFLFSHDLSVNIIQLHEHPGGKYKPHPNAILHTKYDEVVCSFTKVSKCSLLLMYTAVKLKTFTSLVVHTVWIYLSYGGRVGS